MKIKQLLFLAVSFMIINVIFSCSSIPDQATAVQNFEKEKYLGKWFEIARIDFKHERNLNNVTAEYTLNNDGTIKVNNQGYNVKTNEWEQAIGKAKFAGDENVAMLKVSFWGPFYSGYNVIGLDEDYNYALVAGKNHDYLWILSRETTIPEDVKENYLQIAQNAGYDTSELLWVEHNNQE